MVRRYAEAVFQIALEKKDFDRWQADLEKAAEAADEEVLRLLEEPRVPAADKEHVLSERFGELNPLALNLVRLLLARGGLRSLPEIAGEFERLVDDYRGVGRAEVVTAVALDEADRTRVAAELEKTFGKKMKINTRVDPAIIGGLVARVDGKLLDGSTRSRLLALKQVIAGAESGGLVRRRPHDE